MAAHFPAPRSKSFSNPHQLQYESTTPSVTEQVKRHRLFTLSSNTRRRCLSMTLVRATFKKRKGEMVLRMMGRRSGASLPKDAVMAGARLGSGAALGLHKHLEIPWGLMDRQNTSDYKPLRGGGKRAPFLSTSCSAGMNCKVGRDSYLLPSKF